MEQIKAKIQNILQFCNFNDCGVDIDSENKKIAIFINEGDWFKKFLPRLVVDFNCLMRLIVKKHQWDTVIVDINNYRKERERLLAELAKAAARKALLTKADVCLPAMNAYERRLIHVELASRPDVKTESVNEGINRCVVVKPL